MFNAISLVIALAMFAVTATTIPRAGNVMNDVVPPFRLRLAWCTIRVGSPASVTSSTIQPRPYSVSLPDVSTCGVWSFLTVSACSSLPPLIAIPNRTRSDGVDRIAPAPAKQE